MKKQGNTMRGVSVEVKEGNISVALRKLKKKIDDSGKLEDLKARTHFEKPTTERKRKAGAARARWLKKLREQQLPKNMS
jgi:small subunit ribosomal protein S21